MKALILAAGYSTRLYPLTENMPKPLIDVHGRNILERILGKIESTGIRDVYVISNHKFYSHFIEWKNKFETQLHITILDDGSTTNDNRLGAIGDVMFALKEAHIDDDLLVIAGDNLFEFKLSDFIAFFKHKHTTIVGAYDIDSIERARSFGVIETDEHHRMIGFEEKPDNPKTTLISTACYLYPKEVLPLFNTYFQEGNLKDAPGNFLKWLHQRQDVFCFAFKDRWFDIGSFEALEEAKHFYESKKD